MIEQRRNDIQAESLVSSLPAPVRSQPHAVVYKYVRVDNAGRLCSSRAKEPWTLFYGLDIQTVPSDPLSLLFAYASVEDAMDACLGDPVARRMQLYEATTSAIIAVPELIPLGDDPQIWREYWIWYRRGFPRKFRDPRWRLFLPSSTTVLCPDLTLVQHVW
jgi:hypothetical protein